MPDRHHREVSTEPDEVGRRLRPPLPEFIADFAIDGRPHLALIVDAEEEFDWAANFSRDAIQTRSIPRQIAAHRIFDRFGIVPTYAVDYPVASEPRAFGPLREFLSDGHCAIAAHLHPWVNPPFREEVNEHNSYPGNLPRALEKEKLSELKNQLEKSFQQSPIIYRAGRYGFGIHTAKTLIELGFKIDCSVLPHWRVETGDTPDYRNFPERPYWFGPGRQLLEFPTTVGLVGSLEERGETAYGFVSGRLGSVLKLPGVLSRLGLAERIQLTPEGTSLQEAKRLTQALIRRNHRIFVLTYHSTSLLPGSNPYVRDERELSSFMRWLEEYFEFFFGELGGIPSTPVQLYEGAIRPRSVISPASESERRDRGSIFSRIEPGPLTSETRQSEVRCLLVASTFPPLVGGTCVVYHNLCKYGRGAVIPLVPYIDFRTGEPIPGARAYDRVCPYKVYRRRLLRPQYQTGASWFVRLCRAAADLQLLTRVLTNIFWVVIRERINILCVGELTYCGWLILPCKYLLGLKTIIYVHGEEITTIAPGLAERLKFKWLHLADAVVSVSSFTARAMSERAALSPEKIHVISNGVDTGVFRPMPARGDLAKRYGLEGKRVLLSVGRLVERKGIDQVLRALPSVLSYDRNIRYLVVGDGPYRSILQQIAESLSISDHVIFAGEVPPEDLVAHYVLGDIFVQPNRDLADGDTEGFGLVFLEANACGKPAIAGTAGGAPDAVTDGDNGLLVDGRDADAIAKAILRLLATPQLYVELSQGALNRAKNSTWKARVDAFLELCNGLLSGTPHKRFIGSKALHPGE